MVGLRRAAFEYALPGQHFDLDDIAPGLAAVAAGVHRQRAADRAGNAGKEFRVGPVVQRGEARDLRAGDSRLGAYPAAIEADLVQRRVQQHDGAAHATVAHQKVAAEPDDSHWLIVGKLPHERREVLAIGRKERDVSGAAAAPARVLRQWLVAAQVAAQAREAQRLEHHHAGTS